MNIQAYRDRQLRQLTNDTGIYVLCDLDQIPVYVGQSVDGIRARVRRHLTSARSDVVANRQLFVWEIAFVWAFAVPNTKDPSALYPLECYLANLFHMSSPLLNGSIPAPIDAQVQVPEPQKIQILPDEEIERRRDPAVRLPQQARNFTNLLEYILEVKNNPDLRRTLRAHFERLERAYEQFLANYDN